MNSLKVIHGLKFNKRFLFYSQKILSQRTFLSESYLCQEKWNSRFDNELLRTINLNELRAKILDKINNKQAVSALDVDIFVNCINNDLYMNDLGNILLALRSSKETSNTLDSTHYAVIRYLLKAGHHKELLDILNDRLSYGIFPDYHCYSLMMDYFIKKQDFVIAAKVASLMMLQEEFEHPISNSLAIYSCHNYLKNPETWQGVDPKTLIEEPEEEVKIRVSYLVNPYFDDHFDLWKPLDLVGKTLFWIGGRAMDDALGRSCELRGSLIYKKYQEAISLLEMWKSKKHTNIVYKDLLPLIKKDVPEIFEESSDESIKELQILLSELENANLCQNNLDEDIVNLVENTVETYSEEDISQQTTIYNDWHRIRADILSGEIQKFKNVKKLKEIVDLKKDLIKQERILTFFDNEDQIELQIEKKLKKEEKLRGESTNLENYKVYKPPQLVKEMRET